MTLDATRASYDQNRQREWDRLETRAQGRLEFLITMHALRRHLPLPGCRVLDAGGGPGRYTIALAALGYRMTLLDLSPGLIEEARVRIAAAPAQVRTHVDGFVTGSITDLSRFAGGEFDAVICLGGPLSHVIDADERTHAVAELRRVTRLGGTIAISEMGRLGFLRSAVQWLNWFDGGLPQVRFSETVRVSSPPMLAYPFLPGELERLMELSGIEIIRSYGCQGIGAHLQEENLLAIMDDPVRWALWKPELLATCDEPSVIGVSSHLLAVGECCEQSRARYVLVTGIGNMANGMEAGRGCVDDAAHRSGRWSIAGRGIRRRAESARPGESRTGAGRGAMHGLSRTRRTG